MINSLTLIKGAIGLTASTIAPHIVQILPPSEYPILVQLLTQITILLTTIFALFKRRNKK